MALKREYGGIQPCIRLGIFRIRIPFIHFNISGPEIITGLMNACTSYGALAVLILPWAWIPILLTRSLFLRPLAIT